MNSQLLYIVLLAMVAGIVLFRLYTVLGRRTGHERPPSDRFERVSAPEQGKPAEPVLLPDAKRAEPQENAANPATRGLLDIKLADRSFETAHFLDGAKRAYETIVTAFARGDRDRLRPLLSEEVYAAFDHVIAEREKRKDKVEFTFIGFRDANIASASLKNNIADVTVSFGAQFSSVTIDSTGAVIDGNSNAVREVSDVWSFERNVRSSDPNWKLVATSGEAGLQGS